MTSILGLLMVLAAPMVCAQEVGAGWTGEWGSFHRVPAAGRIAAHFEGSGLTVRDCRGSLCQISFEVLGMRSHADAMGELSLQGEEQGVALLRDHNGREKCSLALKRGSGKLPAISVSPRSGDCTYFETPGSSFAHVYPLHTKLLFYLEGDTAECYAGNESALAALCISQALAKQEGQWKQLVQRVSPLGTPALDPDHERAGILARCDGAADPATCVSEGFQRSTDELNARRASWMATVTDAGDPEDAKQAVKAIAGNYMHRFRNGDVSGDKYTSTDTLSIERESDTSIRYEVHLEFYNGHECNRDGVAEFKRNGAFVEQEKLDWADPGNNLCVFEIIPSGAVVRLEDPTGVCRMQDCGARGAYGNSFALKERTGK